MSRTQRRREEWEERRWYLTRSLFENLEPLTPIYEAADQEVHSDSSESLPELIVEVVPKRQCCDEPEEFYQELEKIIKKELKRDADITNGRFSSDTEVALTCDLEKTGSNEDPNSQECSIDSILEAMRCPGTTSSHHTEMVPIIHHSLDSPQTPLAYPKISTPTQLPHSSESTNSSPKRPVTPSLSTYSSSKSPTSSTKSLPRTSTRSLRHASHKYPTTFSPKTHSSPKRLTSSESSSERLSSLASSTRCSSKKRITSVSSPKPLPSSRELPSKRQSLVASPSRSSSRKRQSLIPSPLTHSAPKRQTRSVIPSENSPSQPLSSLTKSSRQSTKGLTSLNSTRRRLSQTSLYNNQINKATQTSLCSNQVNKATQTSLCSNQVNKATQTSLCSNPVNKATQTSLCTNLVNRAVQTSPIGDDSPHNFWRNLFVGEPVIYDIVPRRNLV